MMRLGINWMQRSGSEFRANSALSADQAIIIGGGIYKLLESYGIVVRWVCAGRRTLP